MTRRSEANPPIPADDALNQAIRTVATGGSLGVDAARNAFSSIISGKSSQCEIGALLVGLLARGGETAAEIVGATQALRSAMVPVKAPEGAMDIVGTGGDRSGSLNISTAAALVVAACGVPVAKHGNRAVSSRSGAADVLLSLGLRLDLSPESLGQILERTGFGFMLAPNHHPALKHVGPCRRQLGIRTIFNLLGPLCNPAGVQTMLLGVFAPEWLEPIASVLPQLGIRDAWVVHGSGLDEITTAGTTHVIRCRDGTQESLQISPQDAGLEMSAPDALRGGSPAENARALRSLLDGEANPYRDATCLNAGAALVIAHRASNLREGVERAQQAIDSGQARNVLDAQIALTNA